MTPPAGVWAEVVGQPAVVDELSQAAEAAARLAAGQPSHGMTHAWLLTGPPGSGRSVAARAFAAALECTRPGTTGCGECDGCRTALIGTHADVTLVATELLSIGVKETRELVRQSALAPAVGRWQITVMEDADRLTESAANVLLKAIEEPPARTVWVLCAPSIDDVLPTIRSRCRHLALRTPLSSAVADVLVRRDHIDPDRALEAARAAQGHIGRARRLAVDEQARQRRRDVLRLPAAVTDVGSCLRAAQQLVDATAEEAKQLTQELDEREIADLRAALGVEPSAKRMPPGTASAVKELQTRQKKRATRMQRDALDRALVDIAALYRDVLMVQLGAIGAEAAPGTVEPVHGDQAETVRELAQASTPEGTLRQIDAILECRVAIEANVAPLLAVESLALALQAYTGHHGRR